MKLEDAKTSVLTETAEDNFEVKNLTNSQRFLIQGGNGLKKGETLVIEPQPIVLDKFDLGNGNFSVPTLCVVGVVTSKTGTERAIKLSLSSLKRRSYGTELVSVSKGTFPTIEVNTIDTIIKETENGAKLANELKLKVKDVRKHFFAKFSNNEMIIENGNVVLEARMTPELITIK